MTTPRPRQLVGDGAGAVRRPLPAPPAARATVLASIRTALGYTAPVHVDALAAALPAVVAELRARVDR